MVTKSPFMEIALAQAKDAFSRDEVPVGAVIIDANGKIIAQNGNRTEEKKDPTEIGRAHV